MPAKKKAEAKVSATPKQDGGKVSSAPVETDARIVANREIADETRLRDAREAALKQDPGKAKPDANGDIDERMAALLADHMQMGVRKG